MYHAITLRDYPTKGELSVAPKDQVKLVAACLCGGYKKTLLKLYPYSLR